MRNLKNRTQVLADLNRLPFAALPIDEEGLEFIERRKLWRRGIGLIDAHLLASALLANCRFWTLDRQLNEVSPNTEVKLYGAP